MTKRIAQVFLGLMGLAFCKVGIETLVNPQAVLSNVGIMLDNSSALSSMRAVYGGMHLIFGLACVGAIFKRPEPALQLVLLYTIGFTIGRVSGAMLDGKPNEFVLTWLITEVVCGLVAATLLYTLQRGSITSQ